MPLEQPQMRLTVPTPTDAAQVWGDLDRACSAVASEASALRTVVLLADDLPKDEAAKLRALIGRHIEKAVSEEWPAMEQGRATPARPAAELSEALQKTPTFPATDDAQKIVQREIVSALNSALEARRQPCPAALRWARKLKVRT